MKNIMESKSIKYDLIPTDQILKKMCKNTYTDNIKEKKAEGFHYYDTYENPRTSFYADIYYNNRNVVIVFKGTQEPFDYLADFDMGVKNKLPKQFQDARKLYDTLVSLSDLQGKNFIFTGHSLGGSEAVYLGSQTGDRTVTFNAYGIAHILKNPVYTENITNYGNPKDFVFMRHIQEQIGKVKYVFNTDNFTSKETTAMKKYHLLENMGNIDFASDDITGKDFIKKLNHHLAPQDTAPMLSKMIDKVGSYSRNTPKSCPGYVTVDGYMRNGHEVSGYVRECPYHNN